MSSPCCENGRSLVNPHTGQTVCSCQYPPGLLTYSRMGLPDPVYSNTAYSTTPSYMPLGSDPSAFYPPLNTPYELKEAGETWRGIGQTPGCYPYDPTGVSPYPYSNAYGAMDINSAARRKNATRENTNTLKAWLYEHRKNPYPTKGEKIMLAIITKMTLTQVSTWFANARRRLKKENKMTWSPRNKPGGNDDDEEEEEEESKDKADNDDSDGDNGGSKSPKEDKRSCEREGQISETITDGSSSSSSMRKVHMYDTPPDSAYTTKSRLSCMNSHNLRRCSSNFAPPSLSSETSSSFLNLPPLSRGYPAGGTMSCVTSPDGSMTSATDTSFTSSNKRPDSLCSNSNDSGLSDANCSYPDSSMDGLRPKIWSLAHVATSDAGYASNSNNGAATNSNINSLPRNMISNSRGLGMAAMQGGGLPSAPPGLADSGFHSGRSRHDNIQTSPPSLSPFPSSPSIQPLLGNMPQWGPVYGAPSHLVSGNSKPSCQGTLFSQSFAGMMPGAPMTSPNLNSVPGPHAATPSPNYSKNVTLPTGYYQNSKMSIE